METKELALIIESLLFAISDPLSMDDIKKSVSDMEDEKIVEAIARIQEKYVEGASGVELRKVAGGYQMFTVPSNAAYVMRLRAARHKKKLSPASLETLAIVVYKQPLTRAEIESIRGVGVGQLLHQLLERKLIKVTGRKQVPGTPLLYGTTKEFLKYFGLSELKDLPKIEEISSLIERGRS